MNSSIKFAPILSINKLSKTYSETGINAFSDITFSVNKGEFVSIIGPSGCGKSTLFDILSGVTEPTSGTIKLNGKPATKRSGEFGYMLQSPLLLPWKNVLENITLGLEIKKVPSSLSRQKGSKLLKQFKLYEYADFYPDALSGGIKQRVALIRTILFQSELLLLDEPFGALDSLTRYSCQTWLLDVYQKLKPTILFITHDVREAIFLSDTIYVLSPRPGKIIKKISVSASAKKSLYLEKRILNLLFERNRV